LLLSSFVVSLTCTLCSLLSMKKASCLDAYIGRLDMCKLPTHGKPMGGL
jgi:hypothetical protein